MTNKAMEHGETFRLLLYALLFLHARCVHSDVTCSAGNFTLGGPGSVRCNFGEVINSKHNFNVVRYSGEASDSGDYVLLCNWAGTSLECTVKEGYAFDRQVDCSLTLAIAVVEERMAGMYVCQLVPDHGIPVHTCQLNVIEAAATEQSTDAKKQLPSNLTPPSPEHSSYLTYFISAVAVLLLAVAGFTIGLLVFLRRRNTSARKGKNRDHQSCVSKCCCDLCERVANCFKLLVPSNADQLTANTEEGQAFTGAGAETVDASTRGKGNAQTAEVGTYVTEKHFKQVTYSMSATYVANPPAAPVQPMHLGLGLPSLTTNQSSRPMQSKRETTTDGGSSAHKKSPLPERREQEVEAEGLLRHNPKGTSERPDGTTWYTETERAHDEYVLIDVKDDKQLGAEKPANPDDKDEGFLRTVISKLIK